MSLVQDQRSNRLASRCASALKSARSLLHAGIGRQLLTTTLVVGVVTALVRVVAVGKDLLIASRFGRSDPFEAYVSAFVIPLLITGIFASAINSVLISAYVTAKLHHGRAKANELLSGLTTLTLAFLSLLVVALVVGEKQFLVPFSSAYPADKVLLLRRLYLILLPIIPLSGLASIWSSALNADGRFASVALSPMIMPVASIVAVLLFGSAFNAYAIAIGMTIGFAFHALILGVMATRAGILVSPRWIGWTPELRQVVKLFVPAVLAALLMGSTVAVDQGMAAMLPAGSVAAFNYGTKLVMLVTALGTTALGTSLLPHLSELVALREWSAIRRLVRNYALLIAAVTIPLTALMYFGSDVLVRLIYQRGTFTAADAHVVADVQAFLSLQVPVYLIGIIFVTLITAMRKTNVFVIGNILNVSTNVVFNLLLMRRFGVAGIALSTSFVYVVSFFFLLAFAYHFLRVEERRSMSEAA